MFNVCIINDTVILNINEHFCSELHEEPDTEVNYHVCNMHGHNVSDVLIKASDTGILILMLGHMDYVAQ